MNFWQEMRRRRVIRLAGLYIVGAWVVIEVASVFFPAWGIPDAALRYLFIAAAAGFPVALIFSWYYDITAHGIVRTQPAAAADSNELKLRRMDYFVLSALLAVGLAVLLGSVEKIQEEIQSGHTRTVAVERLANSIAVLPFKNLDINEETGYFSEGITEEILQRLSSNGALHVLASTSSRLFTDSDQPPARVSEALGVRYLLDGSIRRAGGRIRLTTRLLDAGGFQIWSESFDRVMTMSEIFAIQTDIANAVSRQIVREIVPLKDLPAGRTTENMEAYNEYLLGRYEADHRTIGWKQRAEEAFNKAIDLDPGFAPPYAGRAMLVVNSGLGPHWEEARKEAEKSLELDPELAEAHAVFGLISAVLGDPAGGAASLERAIDLNPSYSSSYAWLAIALGWQGFDAEAREALYRGLEKDPLNPILIANLADAEESGGNFKAAEQLLLRLVGLPEISGPATDILELYHDWGRYADELATRKQIMSKTGPESVGELPYLARNYASLGMTAEADYWLDLSVPKEADAIVPIADFYFVYKHYDDPAILGRHLASAELQVKVADKNTRTFLLSYGGLAQIQFGDYAKGVEWLETALELYRQDYDPDSQAGKIDVKLYDENWWSWLVVHVFQRLAFAYQQVDRDSDALDILQQLDDLLEQSIPRTPLQHEWLALQFGLHGDYNSAYESLAAAVDLGWANYYEIQNDPAWAAIIEDPRMRELLDTVRQRVDEQRAGVEEIEKTEDFRAEMRQLLEIE